MWFFNFTNSFYLLSLAFLLQTVSGVDPIKHFCFDHKISFNKGFEYNLDKMINSLSSDAPATGFAEGELGQNSEKVIAFALCTAPLKSQQCQTCLEVGGREIRSRCSTLEYKGGVIWYDDCMLKYANQKSTDYLHSFFQCNPDTVKHPIRFRERKQKLFRRLIKEAQESPDLYAAGDINVGRSERIYGLFQCTRNLSRFECKVCLQNYSRKLRFACHKKVGGSVLSGSCNMRFEVYPF
ncbi:hypothetical protein K2173_013954 [Erythroxylum novogranatense]|uniref:Gnk2-homologous domain-containing protein n=1 Tax=Erythroxylum novogranatense TaxID=1862640 RepID=A0AAV8SD33_9ROSI|nr:hypothetical protein K2173_013954 [Erythroxylum novogranatense]